MLDKGPLARWNRIDFYLLKARTMSIECPINASIRMVFRSCRLSRYRLDVLPSLVGQPSAANTNRHEAQTD